jgi:Uma2 family endonuclease
MAIQPKLKTVADLEAFAALPENRARLFELIAGEIIEKMGSFIPSRIAGWIVYFLNAYLLNHPIGYVTVTDGSYILSEEDAPMPDVAFISRARLPTIPERAVHGPPDLAVEVKSPNDTRRELRRKAELYIRYGVRLVWLVFPEDQTVEVYMADEEVVTMGADGILDGRDVLPGFTLAVADLFRA